MENEKQNGAKCRKPTLTNRNPNDFSFCVLVLNNGGFIFHSTQEKRKKGYIYFTWITEISIKSFIFQRIIIG